MPKLQTGRRQPRRAAPAAAAASSTSLAEINVVPLVDVMLVLLIIFMVTAPMIQRGIDVKLPAVAPRRRGRPASASRSPCPTRIRQIAASSSSARSGRASSAAGARPAEDGDRRREGGVPARRRRRAVSGSDGRLRRAEGGRRREHRHGGRECRASARWTSPTCCAIGCRRPRGLQKMVVGVGRGARRVARGAAVRAARLVCSSAHDAPPTVMTISLGGSAGPRERRHDRDRRPAGAGGRRRPTSRRSARRCGRRRPRRPR